MKFSLPHWTIDFIFYREDNLFFSTSVSMFGDLWRSLLLPRSGAGLQLHEISPHGFMKSKYCQLSFFLAYTPCKILIITHAKH
ncbi:hypothetical protein Y032_0100g3265 [Ancylostoma ceylanicum]|uniref:Uncharacterized protein n=1 Tax=Ancylostoma ceylanicum TaxID=53326 RepID=A0A016TIA1_9BILA|nr:hypothetical protein Y032_0100g3265 [Ancylostoma ceylanicum]